MTVTQDPQQAEIRHAHGNRRVVQHGRASTTSSIAQAVVLKHNELFFLCDPDGDVPLNDAHGLGLYYHDCRYLNGYELRLGDAPADVLATSAGAGVWATFELTNPDLQSEDGHLVEKERIAIKWERTLDDEACALHETIALTNHSVDAVHVPVTIRLRTVFDSLFEVRPIGEARQAAQATLERQHAGVSVRRRRQDPADTHCGL